MDNHVGVLSDVPPPAPVTGIDQQFRGGYQHGISLLSGWFPLTVQIVAVVVVCVVIGWRSRRWWLLWVPIAVLLGVLTALAVRWYTDSEGLSSDPAPRSLWIWTAVAAATLGLAVLGWRSARWWRRGLSILAIPLTLLGVAISLNQWVGYFPTLQTAVSAMTAGPLPDQVDASRLPELRNTAMSTGKVVPVDIPDDHSGFTHRTEYVYLPPAWFAGPTPPQLPALMMIAGEFNTPGDWARTGNAVSIVDAYAQAHGGQAPILAFVDAGGSFNNDTECVDGPRGNAADHLTGDVRPYVVSTFHASPDATKWGVVGWSMGGTCAVDLTVMHPDLFSTFEDIAGDAGPTAGTKQQTIDRLYGGDAAKWAAFDPATVIAAHGPYAGTTGLFEDLNAPTRQRGRPQRQPQAAAANNNDDDNNNGVGGRDHQHDTGETGAARNLCSVATAHGVGCTVLTTSGGHTWQFASKAFEVGLPWLVARM